MESKEYYGMVSYNKEAKKRFQSLSSVEYRAALLPVVLHSWWFFSVVHDVNGPEYGSFGGCQRLRVGVSLGGLKGVDV
jgi:hypothetical protein